MMPIRSFTAISALLLCQLFAAPLAWAANAVGTVVNVNGAMMARKADGAMRILAQKSDVFAGDTLITEAKVYARVRFIDDSEITLRPGSQFKIENFSFDAAKPEADDAKFNLVKGGLRAVSGTLGQRNKERVGFATPTATIGIRGTTFIAEYVPPAAAAYAAFSQASLASAGSVTFSDAPVGLGVVPLLAQAASAPPSPGSGARAPGLYVHVIFGMIHVSNQGGGLNFGAGQFAYVPNQNVPPVLLPHNPGMQFSPPPGFGTSMGGNAQNGNGNDDDLLCEVR